MIKYIRISTFNSKMLESYIDFLLSDMKLLIFPFFPPITFLWGARGGLCIFVSEKWIIKYIRISCGSLSVDKVLNQSLIKNGKDPSQLFALYLLAGLKKEKKKTLQFSIFKIWCTNLRYTCTSVRPFGQLH